jgi:hypothetical protein
MSQETEVVNMVYDTLMKNKQHPQLDLSSVEESEVDANNHQINFLYYNKETGGYDRIKMSFEFECPYIELETKRARFHRPIHSNH